MMATHRGFTHSLLLYPFTAIPIALLWWWFRRTSLPPASDSLRVKFRWLYACVLVALATHPLLDLFTSYGTQLFLPLTHHRYALHGVPIVDIIYTPVLIITLLTCYLLRKRKTPAEKTTLIVGWLASSSPPPTFSPGWVSIIWPSGRSCSIITPKSLPNRPSSMPILSSVRSSSGGHCAVPAYLVRSQTELSLSRKHPSMADGGGDFKPLDSAGDGFT